MSKLYVLVKKMIGLAFLGFLVFLVLGERCVIPSESHLGAVSRDSTISYNIDVIRIIDVNLFSEREGENLSRILVLYPCQGTSIYVTYSMQTLIHLY